MNEDITKSFTRLSNVDSPNPKKYKTEGAIMSNGRISILQKEDGTYSIKNENTGQENGSFTNEQDARSFFNDILSDENETKKN